ncbi:MAG: TonB-dependent receptor [Opitutaceae bacterium]
MYTKCLRQFLSGLTALALSLLAGTQVLGQGVTTAGISGFVLDGAGAPVVGATVTAVHVPSGTRAVATTRSNGEYNFDGLRTGGPYSITVTADNYSSAAKTGVFLDVGSVFEANFTMAGGEVVKMASMNVTATPDDEVFDPSVMSNATSLSAREIQMVPTIRRDVQDVENLDPRANMLQVSPTDTQYAISFEGQNPRENLFLIDGVSATDNFGLNSNGYAGFRNPLPPEWIESMALDLNPYDVVLSGFSGGVLDATLKSGTNDFHGSLYGYYMGTRMRGPDPVPNSIYGSHEPIQMHTTGGTFSGPIIPNKLFFFVGYDAFREIATPPVEEFIPDNSDGDYSTIIKQAQAYGFNPGTFTAVNHLWQQNFVAKLDWNISDSQKFEFTFRHTAGEAPNFYDFTSSYGTSLSSSWYATYRTDQSYTAKLNSDWSQFVPNLHTEIEATYKRYNGTAALNGSDFPAVTINNVPGTSIAGGTAPYSVFLGQYWAYQKNNIYTWEQEEHAYADYSIGAHTFKFGVQLDRTSYTDTFIPNYLGSYTFDSIADWEAGTPTAAEQETPNPGYTLGDDLSHYYLLDIAPLIEDTWHVNDALTLMGGVRADYPYEPQNPLASSIFEKAYGYANNSTMNGNYTISPRLGFNYNFPTKRKTQLRGGIGLFLGQNPVVWVENSFNNAGQLNTLTDYISTSSAPTTAVIPGYTFTGAKPTPLPVNPGTSAPSFDVTSPDFHWPSAWKENLALDRELPFWGAILTLDVDLSQVNKDVITRNLNMKTAASGPAFMPDGAIHYNGNITPGYLGPYNLGLPGTSTSISSISSSSLSANPATGPVYLLTNTNKGATQEYTIQLHRPLQNGWSWSFAYTHTHATEVDPAPSSVASSNYEDNPFVNPNDNIAYNSAYASPDKFVVWVSKEFHFLKRRNTATTISADFIAQTGQAYSYVFKGDADGSGLSGDSLFYVPTGPSDPKVTWGKASEETAFFSWLAQNPELAKYAGRIAPRNAFYAPWEKTLDVHFEQEVPVYGPARLVLFADCFNFANLLDKNWGLITNYDPQYEERTVAGTFLNAATNQYIYTFNPATLGPAFGSTATIYPDMSRWSVQVGARIEF